MSVLLKGMKMPEGCYYCPFADGSWGYSPPHKKRCLVTGKDMPLDEFGVQQNQPCPLVEIPEHGRLIDADALVADLKGQVKRVFCIGAVSEADFWIERNEAFKEALWKNWCESFYEYLDGRPTVIEEEGET